jgi:hypothetical protein
MGGDGVRERRGREGEAMQESVFRLILFCGLSLTSLASHGLHPSVFCHDRMRSMCSLLWDGWGVMCWCCRCFVHFFHSCSLRANGV